MRCDATRFLPYFHRSYSVVHITNKKKWKLTRSRHDHENKRFTEPEYAILNGKGEYNQRKMFRLILTQPILQLISFDRMKDDANKTFHHLRCTICHFSHSFCKSLLFPPSFHIIEAKILNCRTKMVGEVMNKRANGMENGKKRKFG